MNVGADGRDRYKWIKIQCVSLMKHNNRMHTRVEGLDFTLWLALDS